MKVCRFDCILTGGVIFLSLVAMILGYIAVGEVEILMAAVMFEAILLLRAEIYIRKKQHGGW